jgi:hypothetical protein
MTSLYKRATPSQRRILRAVEGTVKSASDAHPSVRMPHNFARSVAKRAAGILSAQWPEVLSASFNGRIDRLERQAFEPPGHGAIRCASRVGRGPPQTPRRSPLPALWKALAQQIGPLKAAGQYEKAAAFVEVLKMIAAIQRGER